MNIHWTKTAFRPAWLMAALVLCLTVTGAPYVCGDADNDGFGPDISDLVYLVTFMFQGGPEPPVMEACDIDGDGSANPNVADLVYLANYMFTDGPEPQCSTVVVPVSYPVVDTEQDQCFDVQVEITCPEQGELYYGQDAQVLGNQVDYTNNGDSTITDNVTGLMWTKSPDWNGDGDIDVDDKFAYYDVASFLDNLNAQGFAGYSDWRLPSIKELYSLMDFSGTDPSGPNSPNPVPFIDTAYFDFGYGDESAGEREIDAQFWTTNIYLGTVFGDQEACFGLNLADGRIKGYPTTAGPSPKLNYVYFVRGDTTYGFNDFEDNGDGTITDHATGLMWMKDDQGDGVSSGPRSGMTWAEALAFAEQKNAESFLGYNDWRLPNAKELQGIVDYTRSPDTTGSAAIDPVFNVTQITNEAGDLDYPWYWTGTTHIRADGFGTSAVYVCFGRGMGYMFGEWMDVHGAGCQRSDNKSGDFTGYTYVYDGYYFGMAPQGDAARMYNYVRLVRDVD
jgi:hypothetical protein